MRAFGGDRWENASVLDRICFIREGQRYPDSFTVQHVLAAGRISFERWDDDLAQDLVDQFRLRSNQRVKKLSAVSCPQSAWCSDSRHGRR